MKVTPELLRKLAWEGARRRGEIMQEPHRRAIWNALNALGGIASTGDIYDAYRKQALPRYCVHVSLRRVTDYLRAWVSEGKLDRTWVSRGRHGATTIWEIVPKENRQA